MIAWSPAVQITIPIEGRPRVGWLCMNDSEEQRLVDWLNSHPEYRQIVIVALRLREEPAA